MSVAGDSYVDQLEARDDQIRELGLIAEPQN